MYKVHWESNVVTNYKYIYPREIREACGTCGCATKVWHGLYIIVPAERVFLWLMPPTTSFVWHATLYVTLLLESTIFLSLSRPLLSEDTLLLFTIYT